MNTTPSPTAADSWQHAWLNGKDIGQGEHEFCTRCGIRKGSPGSEGRCAGAVRFPKPVQSDYDPLA